MHVLVDQNGYELLNIGDLAMLETGLSRIRRAWPGASVAVACHAPGRLAQVDDTSEALGFRFAEMPALRGLPQRVRLGAEQAYKALSPLAPVRVPGVRISPEASVRQAVRRADVVVATGGGYVCDDFWYHGLGVLSVLDAAQRRGLPTAMVGQGLGPLGNPALRALARRVFARLDLLTLRDQRHSVGVLESLGVLRGSGMVGGTEPRELLGPTAVIGSLTHGGPVSVTGDEALGSVIRRLPPTNPEPGRLIGVTLRSSPQSSLDATASIRLGETLREAALRHATDFVALPVSRYDNADDLESTRAVLSDTGSGSGTAPVLHSHDIDSVDGLSAAAARCRVVVTGSYHAGLFALAQGVPVVGLSATDYYHDKLTGLIDLYPGVEVIRVGGAEWSTRLAHAIDRAWQTDDKTRRAGRDRSRELAAAGDAAFAAFATRADDRLAISGRG